MCKLTIYLLNRNNYNPTNEVSVVCKIETNMFNHFWWYKYKKVKRNQKAVEVFLLSLLSIFEK